MLFFGYCFRFYNAPLFQCRLRLIGTGSTRRVLPSQAVLAFQRHPFVSAQRQILQSSYPSTRNRHDDGLVVIQYPSSTRIAFHARNNKTNNRNDGRLESSILEATTLNYPTSAPKTFISAYGIHAVQYVDGSSASRRSTTNNRRWVPRPTSATSATSSSNKNYVKNHSTPWHQFHFHIYQAVVHPLLPMNYPWAVANGYASYSIFSFVGALAGSASMVLSTQTLLMAVVATPAASATGGATTAVAVAGGALNWVLKDGIGQLGGVVVASRLLTGRHSKATEQHHFESNINDANEQVDGNNNSINMERMRASEAASSTSTTKTTIDAHPKLWRLVAAVTLDLAAGLELLTPLILTSTSAFAAAGGSASSTTSLLVLCWACLANVIKNVGFVAASASRAALHQSFAVSQNLADVTAKAASQGMVAGLMGTILGVTISSSLLSLSSIDPITSTTTAVSTTTTTFLVCYGLLAAVHQSCVYLAVRAVAFRDFDRQRLSLVLQHYVAISREKWQIPQYSHLVQFSVAEPYVVSGKLRHIMLTPSQVAERESLLPPSHRYDVLWNNPVDISSWLTIGGNINEAFPQGSSQLLECLDASPDAHHVLNVVANSESKVGTGVHEGKFMVHLIFLESLTSGNDVIFGMLHAHILKDLLRRSSQAGRNTMIAASYKLAQQAMNEDNFISQLMESGWDTDLSAVEECDAKRLAVFRRKTRIPI